MKQLITQFMKFGVVGGIAFVIDYGLMIILTELFGVPYMASTTISFIVSVIFNYFASMRYVFKRRDEMSRRREFLIFAGLSTLGLIWNDLLMLLFVGQFGIDYRIAKIFVTMMVTMWNFVTRKIFLEAKDKQ